MSGHYRHTQVGWVIMAVMALVSAFVLTRLRADRIPTAPLLVVLAIVALVFASLTVEVDREAIRLRFGVGLVRKRIPLAEVRSWREVRNPWYAGWGIRLVPGGMLWNVSGLDAVELDLGTGRRFRIGTDQPAALSRAIEIAVGRPATAIGEPGGRSAPFAGRGPFFALAVVAVILLGSALALVPPLLSLRPPRVAVDARGFRVDSIFYGQQYPWADVTGIELVERLPRIEARTNGFAGAGVLRGHFRVEGLGDGKLFVEQGASPYVQVRLRGGFVIVSLETPEKTQALYDELVRQRPALPPAE
jgi:hypothetical protein